MNTQLTIDLSIILAGFLLMILGAERLVKGASSIATKFNLSKAFIGAVLVGFGTSAPEFFASFYSASIGEGVLTTGNIIGSNVFNSTLVMATCLFFPFKLSKQEQHYSNWVWILLPSFLIIFFLRDLRISSLEGSLLLLPLPVFIYMLFKQEEEEEESVHVNHNDESETKDLGSQNISMPLNMGWVVLGMLGLYFGSDFAVSGSLRVSDQLGLSKAFAGAIILATGTSLPELITTLVAGFKKEISLAMANVIGSNALNVFGVLGASALFHPLTVDKLIAYNHSVYLLLISFMLLPVLMIKSNSFHKFWALILFALYATFFAANQ